MHRSRVLSVVWLAAAVATVQSELFVTEKAVLDHLLQGYEASMPPGMRLQPTLVEISSSVQGLFGIDQQRGLFSVDIFLRGHWKDPRLAYDGLSMNISYPLSRLDLRQSNVWTPDIFIENAVNTEFNEREVMFYVEPDGSVTWSRRLVLSLRCSMSFEDFPFDKQTCAINMMTFHERAEDVVLAFSSDQDAGFTDMRDNEFHDFRQSYVTGIANYTTGAFPFINVEFTMQRMLGYWVINGILPANIFVLISYCGFWINPSAAPARVGLTITCVLITLTMHARIAAAMPVVAYSVWMVDYLLGCTFFNLVAVVSYSIVNFGMTQQNQEN
mmetsp:Transcript_34267/g.90470  ORF Transcript_34267/g.90470 Transcript_34267/m.90470 type:complete len:328 (-) Transcript_34267:250-1233(-)